MTTEATNMQRKDVLTLDLSRFSYADLLLFNAGDLVAGIFLFKEEGFSKIVGIASAFNLALVFPKPIASDNLLPQNRTLRWLPLVPGPSDLVSPRLPQASILGKAK